jgi:hypothetical protein
VVLVDETVDYGQQRHGVLRTLQSSLHDLATDGEDLIAASDVLHSRRRESQAMRDLLLVTLARCCPHLSPSDILAAAGRTA